MRTIGVILVAVVVGLYALWMRLTMRKGGAKAKKGGGGVQIFDVLVKGAFSPNILDVEVGKPVKINFIREESSGCSRFVKFPDFGIRKELPENETVSVEFTPERKGKFGFSCDMGMYQGKLIVK